jgi:hypothetical protein
MASRAYADADEIPRTKTWWIFDHPPHGTCTPGCRSFGTCHCGCGERPTRAIASVVEMKRVRGRPYTFRAGHQARVLIRRSGGHWSKRGIPIERIKPLLTWLHERHGTWEAVASLLRMPTSTIKGYANNSRRRRVPPEAARRIQQLVLAHRPREQASMLDQWESEPGLRPVTGLWPAADRRIARSRQGAI